MKNILKGLLFKLSNNTKLKNFAKKILIHFPKLKAKLVDLRDNSYTPSTKKPKYYKSNFLDAIKTEIQNHKKTGTKA